MHSLEINGLTRLEEGVTALTKSLYNSSSREANVTSAAMASWLATDSSAT